MCSRQHLCRRFDPLRESCEPWNAVLRTTAAFSTLGRSSKTGHALLASNLTVELRPLDDFAGPPWRANYASAVPTTRSKARPKEYHTKWAI
jgi:hypothetical protein